MHFEVDTVSEFTYFQNILLGLADALSKCTGVKRTYLRKMIPLTPGEISTWEDEEGVCLPNDLRSFYSSSNGFSFEWTYTYGDGTPKDCIDGKVEVNPIEKLKRVYGYQTTNDPGINLHNDRFELRLSLESKIFELASLPERGRVVLVYLYPQYESSIWLATTAMDFYYLSDNITAYLRMSIAHLGVPMWQLAYTPEGLPLWAENIFRIISPLSLPFDKTVEQISKEKEGKRDSDFPEVPLNTLDPFLFTTLPRPEVPKPQAQPSSPLLLSSPSPPPSVRSIPEKLRLIRRKQSSPPPIRRESIRTPIRFYKRKPLYYIKKR